MTKPYTESVDYLLTWMTDTNQISDNLGDPVDVFITDGSYTAHNSSYASYQISADPYVHDTFEQSAVVRALNNLNDRKLKRSGDIITGNLRINQNVIVDLDLLVQGGDIISSAGTFNLLNQPTTVSAFQAATSASIGATTGLTSFRHNLNVNGTSLDTTTAAFNLLNTATTLTIGATTGTATLRNATTIVTGTLRVDSASITTDTATTANIFTQASVTTLNIGSSGTAISIGAATGTTTVNNSLTVAGGSGQSFIINDSTTTKFIVDSTNGNTTISGTLGVTGDSTLTGDLAVNGGDITSTSTTFNFITSGSTTVNMANVATTINFGSTAFGAQTVSLFGSSNQTSTYNYATGATQSGLTKTLNFGTSSAAGSTTNINIGSTPGGTILFNSPNLRINSTSNGVIHTSGSNGTIGVLSVAAANRMLLSGNNAAPTWSTTSYPSTVASNRILLCNTSNTMVEGEVYSSDSSINIAFEAGKINFKATSTIASTVNASGDLIVGTTKSGTYTRTLTTVTVTITTHGLSNGSYVLLDFTSGGADDGVYSIFNVTTDTFDITTVASGTIGTSNVTAYSGGSIVGSKTLSLGSSGTIVPTSMIYGKSYHDATITKLIELENSAGVDQFSVDKTGNAILAGNLSVYGNIVNTGPGGAVVTQGIVEDPVTTTSTSEATLLSIAAATYRSVEYQIQAVEGTKYWTYKILAIHDGTNVNFTEYGVAGIGANPVTGFALDISAGNLLLKATSASASSTTYKVIATAIIL